MQLLDRYLNAVRRSLPRSPQDDIVAEISDAIQSEAEEKQAQLARPLTLDEESAMLKAYGHPRLVASRYGGQGYLIGPAFLPFYWYTLRIVIVIALIVAFFGAAIRSGAGGALATFGLVWGSLLTTFFAGVGVVTVVFAILEYAEGRSSRKIGIGQWDPRKLPPPDQYLVPRSQSISELVTNLILMFWILNISWTRHALLYFSAGPVAAEPFQWPFHLSPVWQQIVAPLFILFALNAILNCVNLVRADWVTLRVYAHAAINAGLCLIAAVLLSMRNLVTVSPSALHTAQLVDAAQSLNTIAHWIVAAGVLVCLIVIYCDLRGLRKAKPMPQPSMANGIA